MAREQADHHYLRGAVSPSDVGRAKITFGNVLLDQAATFNLMAALEVLSVANDELSEPLFEPVLLCHDKNSSVKLKNGFKAPVEQQLSDATGLTYCLVHANEPCDPTIASSVAADLRRLHKFGTTLVGVDGGVFALAETGLLDGKNCCVNQTFSASFVENFPQVQISRNLFETDGRCITSVGGMAVVEMMIWLVDQWLDRPQSSTIARRLQLPLVRGPWHEQSVEQTGDLLIPSATVRKAIEIFRSSFGAPIAPSEVAVELGISVRQLERLFARYVGQSPARFYREERLRLARQLLTYTDMPVIEVALEAGFASISHFARCYKEVFGISPRRRQ